MRFFMAGIKTEPIAATSATAEPEISAKNIETPTRTQVANLFAGVLGVLSILVLRPVFADLSQTALAAIVIFAMSGMANVTYFRTLWLMSRTEFLVALVAFLGVLSFGVLPGVVIGVVLSLVILIVHIGDPPTSVLGRTSSGTWRDLERSADARARPRGRRLAPGGTPPVPQRPSAPWPTIRPSSCSLPTRREPPPSTRPG